jgi:hypothetical protein
LPIFSLSGNFYLASNQFTGLGDSNNASYGFGPSISWLIFQGGYVNSMIAQSKGQAATKQHSFQIKQCPRPTQCVLNAKQAGATNTSVSMVLVQ